MALWAWHEDHSESPGGGGGGGGAPWPTARRSHGACLLESGRMLVFGGYANDASLFQDTWLLPQPAAQSTGLASSSSSSSSSSSMPAGEAVRACTATVAEGPCKRHDHCLVAYTSAHADFTAHHADHRCRVFVLGGYTSSSGEDERALGDFWELDRGSPPAPLSSSSSSSSSAAAEDTTAPAQWQWRRLHECSGGGLLPPARANASLTACPTAGVLALFGGYSGWQEPRTMFGDLWLYDCQGGAGWKRALNPKGSAFGEAPRPRSGHGAACVQTADSRTGTTAAPGRNVAEVYVMGGWDGGTAMFSGVHRLQLERQSSPTASLSSSRGGKEQASSNLAVHAAWARVACKGPEPAKRACFGFAALSKPYALVAFGGLDEAWQPLPVWEVHLLDLRDKAWSVVDTRPVYLRSALSAVPGPGDGRNGSENSSGRRHFGHGASLASFSDDESSEGGVVSIHELMGATGENLVPQGGGASLGAGDDGDNEDDDDDDDDGDNEDDDGDDEDDDANWATDDEDGESAESELEGITTLEGQLRSAVRRSDEGAAGQWPHARAFVSCVVVSAEATRQGVGSGLADPSGGLDELWLFGGGKVSSSGSNFDDGWRLRPALWAPHRHTAFARHSLRFRRAVRTLLLVHARQGSVPGRLDKWTWLGVLEFAALTWFDLTP